MKSTLRYNECHINTNVTLALPPLPSVPPPPLRSWTTPPQIVLRGVFIPRPPLGVVSKLRWLRGFTSVDLSANNIDDACGQSLRNLMALKQLRRLDLTGNSLGASAGAAVIESLARCRGLQV